MLKIHGQFSKFRAEHDVILAQRSMVLTHQFQLIEKSSPLFNYWHDWQTKRNPKKTLSIEAMVAIASKRPTLELPKNVYILCTTYENSHNWSHLWDIFQSLRHVENIKGCLLYNHEHSKVNDFQRHIKIMGYDQSCAVNLAEFNYRVPTLIIPELACEPNQIKYNNWIAQKYFKECRQIYEPRNLYLSRKGFVRNVLNEDKILDTNKFDVLYGSESLDEHVGKFRSARKIVTFHGSLLKNLVFCENKPDVLEFCSDKRRDICFLKHAIDCEITKSYTFVPVKPVNESNDITLDESHLSLIRNFIST